MSPASAASRAAGSLAASRRATRALVTCCLSWTLHGAWAADGVTLAESPAQCCLTPALGERAKPLYPAEFLASKRGALVKADLVFVAPDRPPRVTFIDHDADDFTASIETYARQLRVPCMSADGPPVALRQEFSFVPNDGRKVVWTTPVDADTPLRHAELKCLVRPPLQDILYPRRLADSGDYRSGTVAVVLHFFDPQKSPEVTVLDDGGSKYFVRSLQGFFDRMQMPCLQSPVDLDFRFRFQMEGGVTARTLQDTDLKELLAAAQPLRDVPVFFDTARMNCPFDVRLEFQQPFKANAISELDEDVAERHAFLDWLSLQHLRLGAGSTSDLLGQTMLVYIPCATIDL